MHLPHRRGSGRLLAAAAVATVATLAAVAAPTHAGQPTRPGQPPHAGQPSPGKPSQPGKPSPGVIAFQRYTHQQSIEDIYSVPATGGTPDALTSSPGVSDVRPDFSPDGTELALTRSGAVDALWTMQADGSGLAAVPNTGNGQSPAWSPDGSRLAFTAGPPINQELYVVNADGTGLQQLTTNNVWDANPTWSPDGKRLAFHRYNGTESAAAILTLDLTTMSTTQVTGYTHIDTRPDWSSKGELVFSRYLGAGDADLYRVRPDGSGLKQLTSGPLYDDAPSWSPDGRNVAFSRGVPDELYDHHIFRVRANGTGLQQLTFGAVVDLFPTWGPA